jgi:hypothetical protein
MEKTGGRDRLYLYKKSGKTFKKRGCIQIMRKSCKEAHVRNLHIGLPLP